MAFQSLANIENDFSMIKLWISSSKQFASKIKKLKTTCCTSVSFSCSDKIIIFKLVRGKNSPDLSTNQLQSHIEYLLLRLSLCPGLKMLNHFANIALSCSMPVEPQEDKDAKISNTFTIIELEVKSVFFQKQLCGRLIFSEERQSQNENQKFMLVIRLKNASIIAQISIKMKFS